MQTQVTCANPKAFEVALSPLLRDQLWSLILQMHIRERALQLCDWTLRNFPKSQTSRGW